ncbi:Putative_SNF2 family helicase [Hexamita inflata]|uniref:SNF2 family helicase n=1 Tax=Hexamita inflata TaxID=28002 RepID=A0AA86TZ32_9EUKA|nr:Putative SNF2 family helicase [Hexamita inflata]
MTEPCSGETNQITSCDAPKKPVLRIIRKIAPQQQEQQQELPPVVVVPNTYITNALQKSIDKQIQNQKPKSLEKQYLTYILSYQLVHESQQKIQLIFTQSHGIKMFKIGPIMANILGTDVPESEHINYIGQSCWAISMNVKSVNQAIQQISSLKEENIEHYSIHYMKIPNTFTGNIMKIFQPVVQIQQVQNFNLPLYPHQIEAVKRIIKQNGKFLLADAPGLGKSLTALAAAMHYQIPIIILAPSILHNHWKTQINNFVNREQDILRAIKQVVYPYPETRNKTSIISPSTQLASPTTVASNYELLAQNNYDLNFLQILNGLKNKRVKLTEDNYSVLEQNNYRFVVDQSQYVKCEYLKQDKYTKYILVCTLNDVLKCTLPNNVFYIIDECHEYKSVESVRSRSLIQLLFKARHTLFLSATPIVNNVVDLYPVFKILGLDISYSQYLKRYAQLDPVFQRPTGIMNELELKFFLSAFCLRRQHEDLKIPKIRRFVRILSDEDNTGPDHSKTAGEQYRDQTNQKHKQALLFLKEFRNKFRFPFIVFFTNLSNFEPFKEFEGSAQISGSTVAQKRVEIIDQFQRGEIKTLFCTIDSVAVGIDITRAKAVVWLQMEWTVALFLQAEGRIRRLSSQYDTVYSIVLSQNSYWDTRINKILSTKQSITNYFFDEKEDNLSNLEQLTDITLQLSD